MAARVVATCRRARSSNNKATDKQLAGKDANRYQNLILKYPL